MNSAPVSYSESNLVRAVQAYNRCRGGDAVVVKAKVSKVRTSWSFLSGIDQARMVLESEPFGFAVPDPSVFGGTYGIVTNTRYYSIQPSQSIPVGLGVEFNSPRKSDRWYVSLELWYDKKTQQEHFDASHLNSIVHSDATVNLSYLKMPIGIRVNLKEDDNTPYLRAGFTHYFVLDLSASATSEINTNGSVTSASFSPALTKKQGNGFWIGGGYSHKLTHKLKGFLEARFELNTGLSEPSSYSHSSGTALSLLAGVKF